jgi:TetR/AcrR family transcriptional regulator
MAEKHNKKDAIMEAAAKVFSEKGKAGTRMKDIAEEAGVSTALLHYHYNSKDELYYEVLKYYIFDKIQEYNKNLEWDKMTPDAELKEIIGKLVKIHNEFLKTNQYFTRLLVQEMSSGGEILIKICDKMVEDFKNNNSNIKDDLNDEFGDFANKSFSKILLTINELIINQYANEHFLDIILEKNNIDKEKYKKERLEHIIEQVWRILKI